MPWISLSSASAQVSLKLTAKTLEDKEETSADFLDPMVISGRGVLIDISPIISNRDKGCASFWDRSRVGAPVEDDLGDMYARPAPC